MGDWRRAWTSGLGAVFVARRPFLPGATAPWIDSWRSRLGDTHVRALECYATSCLELGGSELPGAARAARELLELAPFRETGHLLLMQSEARGNPAEAIAVYERLRVLLRDELGVNPDRAVQDAYQRLLGSRQGRSTRRCLDAPGWVIPSSWANSVTGRSPARSSTRISRRCGSAIALKTSDVVAARAMGAIICRYRHASSRRNQAGLVR